MILGRGYGLLGSAGGGVMEYPQRKKERLLEINEHFIYCNEYGFYCPSFAIGTGFAMW